MMITFAEIVETLMTPLLVSTQVVLSRHLTTSTVAELSIETLSLRTYYLTPMDM